MMTTMKSCPECSATYNDSVAFCTNDGKLLVEQSDGFSRLCPHCANGIPRDAAQCPYCKADLEPVAGAPQWSAQGSEAKAASPQRNGQKLNWKSKVILVLGLACFVLGVYLIGGYQGRQGSAIRGAQQELQSRDDKIRDLEAQLAQFNKQAEETKTRVDQSNSEVEELKKQLTTSQKALSDVQAKLVQANREVMRLQNVPRAVAQPAPRVASVPRPRAPVVNRSLAVSGTYQTLRPTSVHEQPAGASRRVAEIGKGTRVTVIGSSGDWLEVRSKYGKPPGFIRRDDAALVGGSN